ncbi:unnamed protein product [Gadus morhua 'NCC']
MDTTGDGSSQPEITNDKEGSCCSCRPPTGNNEPSAVLSGHYCDNHRLADEISQNRTGDRNPHGSTLSGDPVDVQHGACPSGCNAVIQCVCTGATMLDLATGAEMSPACTYNRKTGSEVVLSDCRGQGSCIAPHSHPGVMAGTCMDGHTASCSDAAAADTSRHADSPGKTPHTIHNSSHSSHEDVRETQTNLADKTDGDSCTENQNVLNFQGMPANAKELEFKCCISTSHGEGSHMEQGSLSNGSCQPADLNLTQDGGEVVAETDAELPNGALATVDGCYMGGVDGDSNLAFHSGEKSTSLFPTVIVVESPLPSQTNSQDNFSGTSLASTVRTLPPSSTQDTPIGPSGAAVPLGTPSPQQSKEEREDLVEAEALEASSGLRLSYCGSPAPDFLSCSTSCESAPVSPGSRPEADPDEAEPEDTFDYESEENERPGPGVTLGPRNTYASSRRQSAPGELAKSEEPGAGETNTDATLQSRRPGLADYFGRGLFSRKQRPSSQSAPGWKLFGKVPLKESPTKNARTIQQESHPGGMTSVSTPDLLTSGEYEVRQGRASAGSSPTQHAMGRSRKNLEFEPLSTTALILEDRPANLPAKSLEEAQRHRQQYNEIVAEAKKRELKEAQKRQKQVRERLKQEESIANAMVVWNNDILPHWDSMRASRRARDLWWQGLPPNVRGRVWSLAIGNELNITPELYEIFLSRAMEKWRTFDESPSESDADDGASLADRESSLELIKLDISRTFPSLYIFQKDGPYHNLLHSILGAYTCYRPDIGYVQGMSFIAAVLILNMEEADAFISFANLINKPCQMTFFRVDHELMLKYFGAFEVFFEENLPRLFNHFLSSNLTPDLYLIDWIFSLYTKPFPLDVACRVWDVFCRDGEEFLFRVGLGILRLYQDILLQMDFIHIAQFLARLPDEDLLSDRLFSCIAATPMLSGNRKWNQVFTSLMKDPKETEKSGGMMQRS